MDQSSGQGTLKPGLMALPRLVFGLPFGAGIVLHVMTGNDIELGDNFIPVLAGGIFVGIGLILSGWATFV